ncbi:MAG: hypothetical protein AAB443_03330 [Patescibacteria group bacterium]
MNDYEAKRGFLTFFVTLVVAVGIFLSAYYTINTLNTTSTVKEENKSSLSDTPKQELPPTADNKTSVFANLVTETPTNTVAKRVVIETEDSPKVLGAAGPSESTSGAVPTTGSNGISLLILVGSSFVLILAYLTKNKARAYALKTFEKRARQS